MNNERRLACAAVLELTPDEYRITGGNPISAGIGIYCGILAIAYYVGYGAHAAYDYFTK